MRKPITIPQPKVRPGDQVSVENYRMRPPKWEHGECLAARFSVWGRRRSGRHGAWVYTVLLHRRSSEMDNPIRLEVTDDQVDRDT